jgi:anti-sigma B factor antagonist
MEISEQSKDNALVLSLSGRLDTLNYGILEKKLQSLFDENKTRIILNCGDLEYVSSSGLRVLLMYLKKANNVDGKLVLSDLQASIKEIFDISGFTSIFEIYDSEEEALKKL